MFRPLVYIASPYSIGNAAVNVRTQFLVAEQLWAAGFLPYPPLYNHFWHFLNPHEEQYWMAMDREWVLRSDAVLRLPGESRGADEEVIIADAHGIPVFHSLDELQHGMELGMWATRAL